MSRFCVKCAKPLPNYSGKRPTGMCGECYRTCGARRFMPHLTEEQIEENVIAGTNALHRALWREHPNILQYLAMRGSGNVYRGRDR